MAPEQLAGDSSADHRMDIYAAGLLAYELLTGVSPFTSPSPRETLAAQLTRDPKPLDEVSPGVPHSLSVLIMRCLAKDPDARPQRADEVLHELDSLTMPLGVTPQEGSVKSPTRRRPWAGVAAMAILFAVLAGVGYAVTHQRARTTLPPATPAVTAPAVTLPAPSESLVKRAAAASGIAPPPVAKPLITRDDSVRIAEAVRRRLDAAKTRDSIAKAKLAEQTQRKMMDSIIAANSGAAAVTASSPRRVIIAEPPEIRQWPEAALLGRAVADSLRRILRPRTRQYIMVDPDSVRSALVRSRDIAEITRTLNSELLVSIRLTALPHDSALLILQAYDFGAAGSRSRAAAGRPVPKNQVLENLDALLLSTVNYLDEMSRSPRRVPPP
jgi:serine/threonine-protein kinase